MIDRDSYAIKLLVDTMSRTETREAILRAMSHSFGMWQTVPTPKEFVASVVGECIDRSQDHASAHHVVLFNYEFVAELVFARRISGRNVLFVADTEDRARVAIELYGVNATVIPQDMRDPTKVIEHVKIKFIECFYGDSQTMPFKDNIEDNKMIVYGNPPYQREYVQSKGKESRLSAPIYPGFVEAIVRILRPRYYCFIIPARWMVGGKGMDDFRAWMLSGAGMSADDKKRHLGLLVDIKDPSSVFTANTIAGGICYFFWDRNHDDDTTYVTAKMKGRFPKKINNATRRLDLHDIFIRDNLGEIIHSKVQAKHTGKYLGQKVSAMKPFGIPGTQPTIPRGVPCLYKQSMGMLFVDPKCVKDPRGDMNLYKVVAPRSPGSGSQDLSKPLKLLSTTNTFILNPGEICSETYIVLSSFETRKEAKRFLSYVHTKFFRFMLSLRVVTQDITRDRYDWVPDFGSYLKTRDDSWLFDYFEFTEAEVAHINARIR